MADKDIKQRIVLEGEKEYSSALKEAQRNLKVLRSELKAETAELGKNASEQQKTEARLKNLNKQIAEQEKVVKTYEKALEEVRQKYGDNEDAIAKWEIKLNEARAALANMQNDLNGIGNSYKNIESGAELSVMANKSLADSFASIASMGETVSSAIEGAFSSIKDKVIDAARFVFGEITDLAARANNLSDLAGYWNTDAANVQKWQRAVKGSANDIEDLNQAVQKINLGDDKKIAELVGVSSENYADKWNYAMAVMDAMSMMDYEARENAAKQIFGARGTTKAYDLLNEWENIKSLLSRYDAENGGVGMDNEMIETFNQISVNLATIQTTWEAFKEEFEAGLLGELTLNLTSNAQGILDSLIAFMGADNEQDRENAIKQLEENMTAFFTSIGEALKKASEALNKVGGELADSDNGYVALIGKALQSLSNVLDWFAHPENWETVKRGFEAIIGVWASGKIISALNNMASFKLHLENIGKHLGLGKGGGSTDSSSGNGTSTTGGGWVAKTLEGLLNGLDMTGALRVMDIVSSMFKDEMAGLTPEEQQAKALMHDLGVTQEELESFSDPMSWTGRGHSFGEETEPLFTEEQKAAAESLWDLYRSGDIYSAAAAYQNLPTLFEENDYALEELTNKLDELLNDFENTQYMEDLPSDWWTNQNQITSEDISGLRTLPGNISAAVRNGVSNIRVTMDGATVGRLVAPYVSEMIARDMV